MEGMQLNLEARVPKFESSKRHVGSLWSHPLDILSRNDRKRDKAGLPKPILKYTMIDGKILAYESFNDHTSTKSKHNHCHMININASTRETLVPS